MPTASKESIEAPSWIWRLPVPWILALRYLSAARREASVRFMSRVTAIGLTIGVAALVIAVAALAGFQDALLADVERHSPALQVRLRSENEATTAREILRDIPAVAGSQQVRTANGWLRHPRQGVMPIEAVGYETRVPAWFPGRGGDTPDGALVAGQLANRWLLRRGDTVQVVSPRPMLSPLGRQIPRMRRVPVAGFFDAGATEDYRTRIGLPLDTVETLFGPGEVWLDVELAGATTAARANRVARSLRRRAPGLEVRTFRDLNRALFFVLRMEKTLMFLAVFLIVLVASQALISSLSLVITSKLPELAVLRTLGLSPRRLRRAVLYYGIVLAGTGIGLGTILGSLTATILDRGRLLRLPEAVYVVEYVPFLVRPWQDLALIVIASTVLSLLAARWASQRVSQREVAEALRV